MDIIFSSNKLEKYAHDYELAKRKLGEPMAKKFKQRLDDLWAAPNLEVVKHLPGRFHELSSNLKGHWACDLEHPQRLLFKPQNEPIPINDAGQYIWEEIKGIEIIEILDYHK